LTTELLNCVVEFGSGWPAVGLHEAARLPVTRFQKHETGATVGRCRAELGAGRHLGDQIHQIVNDPTCERPVAPAVGNEPWDVDDRIAVEEAAGNLSLWIVSAPLSS